LYAGATDNLGVPDSLASQPLKPGSAPGAVARQVLTFGLGAESYGVDILRVQEIRGWAPVTRIPQAPPHVLGVLNLRGSIVPIIDLRRRFGLERAEFTSVTVVVVLSIECAPGRREVGIVVDHVSDVVDLDARDLAEPSGLGMQMNADFIEALATVDERMLILLNVDELIRRDMEPAPVSALAGAA
jgi:purine-binding chemotaxis protein CheW